MPTPLRLRAGASTCSALVVALLAACADDPSPSPGPATPSPVTTRADVIGRADQPASLLVLAPTATAGDRARVERTLAALGGNLVAALPPRLVVAQVPPGADAVLADLGVVARFDRAAGPADLADATLAEERFLSVHAARWFPDQVPPRARLAPTVRLRPEGEQEGRFAPHAMFLRPGPIEQDPEDQVAVPYASGTVAVSIILPESNGSLDPSTEDWNEALVRETQLKITAALDRIAASDPQGDLRFVVHQESAPAAGGLDGTVDTRFEFGQHANWGSSTEYLATADVLGRVLGRELTEWDVWGAAIEYTAGLKRQHQADAAFFVIVAANGNGTAGLRAHAFINGPWTVLDSGYGHETFAHEFGHIFGALDEYCPDACISPSAIHGYLGMYNANAQGTPESGGVDGGHGEAAPSLMQYNQPGAINGYTRGAFGWLDSDGDGLIEVRDTAPKSELWLEAVGAEVRLVGTIVDRPATRVWAMPYSMNRIVAVEYAFAAEGPWLRLPLAGDRRGRQAVDVSLGELPAGNVTVWVRAVNSAGNVEPRPVALGVRREDVVDVGNTAPHGHLDAPARGGSATALTVTTTAVDLEGDAVTVRYDLDGDGAFDTGPLAPGAFTFTPAAGLRTVRAELRDVHGATRVVEATVPVVSGQAAPSIALGPLPSLVHGTTLARVTASVTAPAALVGATAELATDDEQLALPVAIGADGTLAVDLPAPTTLRLRSLDLAAGDRSLGNRDIRDLLVLGDDLIAVAAGTGGLWVVDIADRDRPQVVAVVPLQTTANRLRRAGDRLYVLGSYLTVVDISDPRAPVAQTAGAMVHDSTEASVDEAVGISDGDRGWSSHFLVTTLGARIHRTTVRVTLDHPRLADLVIRLVPDKSSGLEPIVLWDHRAAPGGRRTLTFSSTSNHALRALDGLFADSVWQLEVEDTEANGLAGVLLRTEVELATRARAARVIDGASELAGFTASGRLVVVGHGVEVLDVRVPAAIRSLGRLAGTGTISASMVGDTAIVSAPLESKNPDGSPSGAPVRGLCAVRAAAAPSLVRCEPLPVSEHAQLAGRLYVGDRPRCGEERCPEPVTYVGDAARFAAGLPWQLGATPLRVDRHAFGDASTVWTVNDRGSIDRLDVTDPAAITVAERFARTYTVRLVPLALPEVLLFDFGPIARVGRLDDVWSVLSRVYRLTVTATDAAGGEARVVRHVHVIPYDQAPTGVELAVVPGRDEWSPGQLQITVRDPDDLATWDPVRFARVDWDADGVFDTDWQWIGSDGLGGFTTWVELPWGASGTAVVEARDGFWATTRGTIALP